MPKPDLELSLNIRSKDTIWQRIYVIKDMTKFYCAYWLSQNYSIHWRLKCQANIDKVLRERDPSSCLPSSLVLIPSRVRWNNFPSGNPIMACPSFLVPLGYQPESLIRLSMLWPWPWTHLPPLFPSFSRFQTLCFLRLFNQAMLSPTSGTLHTLFPLLGTPVFLLPLLIHWTQRKCHYSDL